MSHACHSFWKCWNYKTLTFLLTFEKVHNPLRLPRESTSELPKVARTCSVFYILTSKRASRHNGVHFFDISTSKSGPSMVCFVHFDFEMCFAPQRRTLFRHLNFQKWSEHGVLCTFWLRNVLRATTARIFSTSQLPKVVRAWGVFYILTWKCASRHNGVQFFISFRPPEATNQWKNTVFRDFPTFSRTFIFFLLTLSLLWSSLFYSSLLSDSAHLCFSSVHIVGSLTSKLPSNIAISPPGVLVCFLGLLYFMQPSCFINLVSWMVLVLWYSDWLQLDYGHELFGAAEALNINVLKKLKSHARVWSWNWFCICMCFFIMLLCLLSKLSRDLTLQIWKMTRLLLGCRAIACEFSNLEFEVAAKLLIVF